MSWKGDLMKAGIFVNGPVVTIPGYQTNVGQGKTIYLSGIGVATNAGTSPTAPLLTLAAAKAKLRTGKNDTIRLLASTTSSAVAAAVDWSLNLCNLVGEGSFGMMNMRSRLEQTVAGSPMLTVSGYGNSFQNIYFMHGTGSSSNVILCDVTGARNSFINCHFGGPQTATEAALATYRLVRIKNSETYFRNCVFGFDSMPITAGLSLVEFNSNANPPRAVFDDCLFQMVVDAAGGQGATFMNVVAGSGRAIMYFRNCQFVNGGNADLTYALSKSSIAQDGAIMVFDSRCTFVGVSDVVPLAGEAAVWFGGSNTPINQVTGGASVALFNGIACHPDVS